MGTAQRTSVQRGTFGFLGYRGCFKLPEDRHHVRRLRWCVLGYRLKCLSKLQSIHEGAFYVSPYNIDRFDKFAAISIPRFVGKVKQIHTELDTQVSMMQFLRDKALGLLLAA